MRADQQTGRIGRGCRAKGNRKEKKPEEKKVYVEIELGSKYMKIP